MDPPDNIKLDYETYEDNMPHDLYINKLYEWVEAAIKKAEVVWVSFNAKYTLEMGAIGLSLRNCYDLNFKACQQVFTFGQQRPNDLKNCHRPLYRFTRKGVELYPEAVKVESWRQKNGDKRAAAGGCVPSDTPDFPYEAPEAAAVSRWLAAAIDDPTSCAEFKGDIARWLDAAEPNTFHYSRVVGNSGQRRAWHKTQLHEGLVERCLRLTMREGDTVVDPFGGTGTTLRVARRCGFACTLVEMDATYCGHIAAENQMSSMGKGRWGAME